MNMLLYTDQGGNYPYGAVYVGSTAYAITSSSAITDTIWHHYAFVRNGNTITLYIDGVSKGTVSVTGLTVNNSANKLAIGRPGEYAGQYMNGWIDEFRFSKGIARWTSNFTPPGSAYSATATPTPTAIPTTIESRTYTYDTNHPHAVASLTAGASTLGTYTYDLNGNMTCRVEVGITYKQTYNVENRITSIAKLASGDCTTPGNYVAKWDFAYDGDGVRAATLITPYDGSGQPQTPTLTVYYCGVAYEVTGSSVKKYYSFGGQTVAMKDASGLQYFLTDHLGSVVAVTNSSGTLTSQQRYLPFGQERADVGTIAQTDYGYTGQRDDSYIKLLDFNFRWMDPLLGRFVSPDDIVPDPANPQSLNRYSYVMNEPTKLYDPTGHDPWGCDDKTVVCDRKYIRDRNGVIGGKEVPAEGRQATNTSDGVGPNDSVHDTRDEHNIYLRNQQTGDYYWEFEGDNPVSYFTIILNVRKWFLANSDWYPTALGKMWNQPPDVQTVLSYSHFASGIRTTDPHGLLVDRFTVTNLTSENMAVRIEATAKSNGLTIAREQGQVLIGSHSSAEVINAPFAILSNVNNFVVTMLFNSDSHVGSTQYELQQ